MACGRLNLWTMGRLADPQAPPPTHPQSTRSPPKGAEWVGATPGVRKAQEVQTALSPHGTRHPISGRAPCGQLLSLTMVSEEGWASLGQAPRTSGFSVMP